MQNSDVLVFTVADSRYFVGAVAMINSLRLTGYDGEIALGDLGLSEAQRSLLRGNCRILDLTTRTRRPHLLVTAVRELQHQGVLVFIDSDIVIGGSLSSMVSVARDGKIVAIRDSDPRRCRGEWSDLLELRAPLRSEVYVNSGFVALSTIENPDFLPRWDELCERVSNLLDENELGSNPSPEVTSALASFDQDALNALLMSEQPEGSLYAVPQELAPGEFNMRYEIHVVEVDALACEFRGTKPLILHWWGRPKPWSPRPWRGVRRDAYNVLLRRLVARRDVAVVATPEMLPLWLRSGFAGAVAYWSYVAMGWIRTSIQLIRRSVRHVRA
jgi:hypothetical protein